MATPINYRHPEKRSRIGKWNDSAYEASREELQEQLEELELAEAFRRLYEQQMDVGFIQDDPSQVERFQCRSDDGDDRITFIFCTELEDQLIKEQKVNFLHMWRVLESVHPPQCSGLDWAAEIQS